MADFTSGIDWKQFEALATFAFESHGFKVLKNYRLKNPRMEVDLVAIRNLRAFAADCKRWRRAVGERSMLVVARKQVERSARILAEEGLDEIVPMIITWREEMVKVLENGVPVVPIHKLSDFILNFGASEGRILVIENRV